MSSVPQYDLTLPTTKRGLSAPLWRNILGAYVSNDPQFGVRFTDDFIRRISSAVSGTTSATAELFWSAADAAAAGGTYSLVIVENPDGHARLGSTGTTNHFGVEAQGPPMVALPTHTTLARGAVVYEARLDFEDADTVFAGLSEAGDNFLSSSSALPSDSDYLGYYTADNGTTVVFHAHNDNAGATASSASYTIPASLLASSGFNKLGFRVNTDSSLELCVNGQWIPASVHGITSASLPIETLVPRLSATAGGGTTAPNILVDRVDVFVAAN